MVKEYTVKDVYSKIVNINSGDYEGVFWKLWKVKSLPSSQIWEDKLY